MAKKFDLNGVPSVVEARSTVTGGESVASIVSPQPPETSVSALIRDVLEMNEDAAVIIVDPNARKVTAVGYADADNMFDSIGALAGQKVPVIPTPGQSGRSLEWEYDEASAAFIALPATIKAAIQKAVDPVKPKRSVESLVTAILSAEFADGVYPSIVINQHAKTVQVISTGENAMDDAVTTPAPAGKQVQFALSGTNSTITSGSSLPFEGGTV